MTLRFAAAALLLLLVGCTQPDQSGQSAQAGCYQWNPVEQAVANVVPWAPKQSPGCAR